MNAKPNYDSGYIKVIPRHAGDFGCVSISGECYKDDRHLKEMEYEIERHIDRVRSATIYYELYTCGKCDENYETKKEAEECCSELLTSPI